MAFVLCIILIWNGMALGGSYNIDPYVGKITCPDARILGASLFNGVCWSCLFPIRLFGANVFDPDHGGTPNGANSQALCFCQGEDGQLPTIGFALGFWQPTFLLEAVRRPMCFPSLFGMTMGDGSIPLFQKPYGGNQAMDTDSTADNTGFYNTHLLAFPLLAILDLLHIPRCHPFKFTDLDILMFSEIFPNWNNPVLSSILNPEAVLFAGTVGLAAQPLECGAMVAGSRPKDEMFWTAGCWGNLVPFTGGESPNTSPVRVSSLAVTRLMAMMGRLGFLERTVGSDALCKPKRTVIMKKSQFKYQMMFPINESKGPPRTGGGESVGGDTTFGGVQVPEVDPSAFMDSCCHFAGKHTFQWGEWRTRPATGEDFVYLVWQWVDCCIGAMPGT